MRTVTEIVCPLSGGYLVNTGATSNGFTHFYESDKNKGIRFRRYRLDWSILELKGAEGRYFHINGNDAVEVQKIGDKWLTLNASDDEKQKALDDHSKRMKHAMENMTFPKMNVSPKSIGDSIMPVLPMNGPPKNGSKLGFEIGLVYSEDYVEPNPVVDKDSRPNISVDDCALVEYITGKVTDVDNDNLDQFKEKGAELGDVIYEWDMGGWNAMAGRAGLSIFRDDEYVESWMTKMS